MRIHHEPTRYPIRDSRSEVAADNMKTEIDAGGASGGSQDVGFVDVKDIRFDADLRILLRQLGCVQPVCGCAPAIQQTCRGKHEYSRADRDEAGSASVSAGQRFQQTRWRLLIRPPSGNDDGSCRRQAFDSFLGQDLQTTCRMERS